MAETGVSRNDRSARGQIAGAAVTEPAAAKADILVLGHRELASGLLNVAAILVERSTDGPGVHDTPAVFLQHPLVVMPNPRKRQFDRLFAARGQVQDFSKLQILSPRIKIAVELDFLFPPSRPLRNRRETRASIVGGRLPVIQQDGLTCWVIMEVRLWYSTVGLAQILSKRKVMRVRPDKVSYLCVALVQLDLRKSGIRFQI